MVKGDYLQAILRSKKTVFTLKDIYLLWQTEDINSARVRLNYYVKKGHLIRLRRGIYVKDKDYSKLELAPRIFTPSYVSFETVLVKEGLIFQFHTSITIASYLNREISVDEHIYSYRKIRDSILLSTQGVEQKDNLSIASKERAFLDTLYLNYHYHFDNLRSIDWEKVDLLLPFYNNKRMNRRVKELSERLEE